MIELKNISKQYRGIAVNNDSGVYLWIRNFVSLTSNRATPLLALNDISLSVTPGEIFGIYGENGAGKTTLIKILSGLLYPTIGEIKIDGHSDRKYIKSTVSYISTNGWMGLEWQLTAHENLILYGNLFGLSGKILKHRCTDVLEAVDMTMDKDKFISQLSAGMRQKITIARGLILNRPIVFYDEPSVSLDVQSAGSLRTLIKNDAAQNKRTAIIASHNAVDLSICDRIMFLWKGKIIAIGNTDELKRPFTGMEIIEIICLKQYRDFQIDKLQGIERIIYSQSDGSRAGERDVQNIKIIYRKNEFSLNQLVNLLIEKSVTVQSIKPVDFTLQEMYEHYLEHNGGQNHAA